MAEKGSSGSHYKPQEQLTEIFSYVSIVNIKFVSYLGSVS